MKNTQQKVPVSLNSQSAELDLNSLSLEFDQAAFRFFKKFNGDPPVMNLHDFLTCFERAVIFGTLTNTNGCQRSAARYLKLKNSTFNRMVKVQNIQFIKIPVLPAKGAKKEYENSLREAK